MPFGNGGCFVQAGSLRYEGPCPTTITGVQANWIFF